MLCSQFPLSPLVSSVSDKTHLEFCQQQKYFCTKHLKSWRVESDTVHIAHLDKAMNRFQQSGPKLNMDKWELQDREISLGLN